MRHPKRSVLADVLKTKQSHHKGKKRNLKDADIEIEAESINNEDQLLIKVIPSGIHVVIDSAILLRLVFWSGTTFKEIIKEYRRYLSPKYKICQIVFDENK